MIIVILPRTKLIKHRLGFDLAFQLTPSHLFHRQHVFIRFLSPTEVFRGVSPFFLAAVDALSSFVSSYSSSRSILLRL